MEQPTVPPAAPAPTSPESPTPPSETITASIEAVQKNDFTAFQEAEAAKRAGKPKADVPATPQAATELPTSTSAAPDTSAPLQTPPLSKRQQEANERTRRAVEAATADLQRQLDETRAQLRQHAPPPPAQTQPTPREPEWKRFASMPDAPKLNDVDAQGNAIYSTVEEHTAAMSYFIATKLQQETVAASQQQEFDAQRQRFLQARGTKFQEKLSAAADADPEFLDKIPPAVATARPLSGLTSEERKSATFANVAAEAAFRSEDPATLLTYLHAHQDEVVAIAQQPQSEWLPRLIHLDGRLSGAPSSSAAPAPPAPAASAPSSPISAAPPPPPTIRRTGSASDPKQTALEKGDFATFQKLEHAERAAKRASA